MFPKPYHNSTAEHFPYTAMKYLFDVHLHHIEVSSVIRDKFAILRILVTFLEASTFVSLCYFCTNVSTDIKITCVLQTLQITFSDMTTVYISKTWRIIDDISWGPFKWRQQKKTWRLYAFYLTSVFEIVLSDTISHWLPTTPRAQWRRRRNNLEFQTHLPEDFSISGLF